MINTAITDLIAQLEAVTKGNVELDKIIGRLVETYSAPDRGDPFGYAPLYTISLDYALTLVPKGWSWRVGNLPSGRGFADLGTQRSLQCVEGATPALALCIAALKARITITV